MRGTRRVLVAKETIELQPLSTVQGRSVCGRFSCNMSYNLNSLKGGYIGDYIGNYYRDIRGDTRSLDYSSHDCQHRCFFQQPFTTQLFRRWCWLLREGCAIKPRKEPYHSLQAHANAHGHWRCFSSDKVFPNACLKQCVRARPVKLSDAPRRA